MGCLSPPSSRARFESCPRSKFLICKSKTLFESASCDRHFGRITNDRSVAGAVRGTRFAAKGLELFLYDLGVLDHGDSAALGHFALQSDRFAAVLSQLIVHRLVFADDEIRFAVADDPDRTATLDALGPARLPVLLADSIVIDVAHHIHDFAGHFFRSG